LAIEDIPAASASADDGNPVSFESSGQGTDTGAVRVVIAGSYSALFIGISDD
jgi:hypothetical protein